MTEIMYTKPNEDEIKQFLTFASKMQNDIIDVCADYEKLITSRIKRTVRRLADDELVVNEVPDIFDTQSRYKDLYNRYFEDYVDYPLQLCVDGEYKTVIEAIKVSLPYMKNNFGGDIINNLPIWDKITSFVGRVSLRDCELLEKLATEIDELIDDLIKEVLKTLANYNEKDYNQIMTSS